MKHLRGNQLPQDPRNDSEDDREYPPFRDPNSIAVKAIRWRDRALYVVSMAMVGAAISHDLAQPEQAETNLRPVSYAEATQAAKDVANRFDACKIITPPVTSHVYKVPSTNGRTERAQVDLTLQGTRNQKGIAAEEAFADDDRVMWDSAVKGFIVAKDENGQPKRGNLIDNVGTKMAPSKIGDDISRVSLYPKTDYPAGTEIAVYAGTYTTTSLVLRPNYVEPNVFESSQSKYCGTIAYERDEATGQLNWQLALPDTTSVLPDFGADRERPSHPN